MAGGPEVKALKLSCPHCGSGQFSISELGVVGRPKEWGPEVLGVADCRGCQRPFLVKLPQELAMLIFKRIEHALDPHYAKSTREMLGL